MNSFECVFLTLGSGEIACWRDPKNAGKPILLLAHGNGLSALCQIELMEHLANHFDVCGIDFRGHGASRLPTPSQPHDPWKFYEEDLENVIEDHFGQAVFYAGHSMGGVAALRLAKRRPDLFAAIAAIDPAILPNLKAKIYPLIRRLNQAHRVNTLYRGALRRRYTWENRAEALAYFTGRKALASWPPRAVESYVDSCLNETSDGDFQLSCSPDWEARTFLYVPTEIGPNLANQSVPTLLIRAENGSMYARNLQLAEKMDLIDVPGSHFVHLEDPAMVSGHISKFLNTVVLS